MLEPGGNYLEALDADAVVHDDEEGDGVGDDGVPHALDDVAQRLSLPARGPAVEREAAVPQHVGPVEGPDEREGELEAEGGERAPLEEAARSHEVCGGQTASVSLDRGADTDSESQR
eukprot:340894-Rhodomonas_salina.2